MTDLQATKEDLQEEQRASAEFDNQRIIQDLNSGKAEDLIASTDTGVRLAAILAKADELGKRGKVFDLIRARASEIIESHKQELQALPEGEARTQALPSIFDDINAFQRVFDPTFWNNSIIAGLRKIANES